MTKPKRIDARYKWELEKRIWKRHPEWNLGEVRAVAEVIARAIARAIATEVGKYPDLCRARDQDQARFGDAEQRGQAEVDVRRER